MVDKSKIKVIAMDLAGHLSVFNDAGLGIDTGNAAYRFAAG